MRPSTRISPALLVTYRPLLVPMKFPLLSVSRNSTSESGSRFSSSETFVISKDPNGALPNRRVTTSCSLPEI